MNSKFLLLIFILISLNNPLFSQRESKKDIPLSRRNAGTPDSVISRIPMVPPDLSKKHTTPFVKSDDAVSFSMPVLPNRGNNPKDTPALKYKPFKKKKGIK